MCGLLVPSATIKMSKVFASTNQQRFRKRVQPRFVVMAYTAMRHARRISVRTTVALSSCCLGKGRQVRKDPLGLPDWSGQPAPLGRKALQALRDQRGKKATGDRLAPQDQLVQQDPQDRPALQALRDQRGKKATRDYLAPQDQSVQQAPQDRPAL